MADVRYTGKIDSFTEGYVKKCVRQLIGKFGITVSDAEDIEQKLFLKLAKYLPCDDPDDPQWKAFVAKTVKRCIANIVRDTRAGKRDHRRVRSIHVVIGVDDEGPVELADTIEEHEVPARRQQRRRTDQELASLQMDLDELTAELLDERHREFMQRLKHDSILQVARDMDVPPTTLSSWLRKLRQKFEDTGLRDYL
jgi:RNA polymerase sigma-70 factor, ECF subfamily